MMVIANYRIARSILYPPFAFCFMWLLDLGVYRLNLIDMDPIHSDTLAIIGIGALVFSFGGGLSFLIPKGLLRMRVILAPRVIRNHVAKYGFTILLLICFPYIVHHLLQLAAQGTGNTLLERARNASVDSSLAGNTESNPIIIWFIPVATFLAILFQMECRDRMFWFMAFVAFVANILSGGRTGLLTLIAALTTVYLIQERKDSFAHAIRVIRIPLVIFLGLYILLIFVNKNTSAIGGGTGTIILYFLVTYLVGPTAAFDYVVQHPSQYIGAPNHTFEFFLKAASAIHLLNYTPPPQFDQFLSVPFPMNVYTVYKFYFTDFGIWGCFGCIFIIGFLHSAIYRKATNGSKLALFLFALSVYTVIMVIFDDLYFVVGYFLRAAVFCLLYLNLSGIPFRILPPGVKRGFRRSSEGQLVQSLDI